MIYRFHRYFRYLESDQLAQRVLMGLLMAAAFSIIGWLVPDIYYRHIDQREYLSIDSPISVDKTYYKPGDFVGVSTGIEAHIDLQAVVLTELVLVKTDSGDYARVDGSQIIQQAPFRKSDHHIVTSYLKLPDSIADGIYYWKGNACYQVRGYQRCESYISQTFNVTESGLSPTGDKLQQQIDELK